MDKLGLLLFALFHLSACEDTAKKRIIHEYKPTKGAIWPKPLKQTVSYNVYRIDKDFEFQFYQETCTILNEAIARVKNYLHKLEDTALAYYPDERRCMNERRMAGEEVPVLVALSINLTKPCDHKPHLCMDESYTLMVSNNGSILHSNSVWGIVRGLESFAQSFYISDTHSPYIFINQTYIRDAPRYRHRGIMIDTARHFISMKKMLVILDAMAMNKLNVLHWHITDDESFPFVSKTFPDLSKKGAYTERFQYHPEDIELLLKQATYRGIRIIPEFDMPSHSRAWGIAQPSLLTRCYVGNEPKSRGPMNPIRNSTYRFLKDFFNDAHSAFPDDYIHLGGDEVNLDCWAGNPNIKEYMTINKATPNDLYSLFLRKILDRLTTKTPIFWQDVFEDQVKIPKNKSVIQTWSHPEIASKILKAGYKLIYSSPWNLDDLDRSFEQMYQVEPSSLAFSTSDNILGGEALLWTELVDDRNVLQRIFPRASAVAEVLWSPKRENSCADDPVPLEDMERITEHVCRMQRLGIPAEPVSPGFCFRIVQF